MRVKGQVYILVPLQQDELTSCSCLEEAKLGRRMSALSKDGAMDCHHRSGDKREDAKRHSHGS